MPLHKFAGTRACIEPSALGRSFIAVAVRRIVALGEVFVYAGGKMVDVWVSLGCSKWCSVLTWCMLICVN